MAGVLPAATRRLWADEVETPAVLIDLDIVERNIAKCQAHCQRLGYSLRPHIKTHKLPLPARAQIDAGATGITCQKISEAEVMVDAGFDDILISYNIVGEIKLNRLWALAQRVRLITCADSSAVVAGLGARFANSKKPLDLLVECDTGLRLERAGNSGQLPGSGPRHHRGSKALSSDLFGLTGHGLVLGQPTMEIPALSEEHGHLELAGGKEGVGFGVGSTLRIIPNHACVVSNLFDQVTLIRGRHFVKHQKVAARGAVL